MAERILFCSSEAYPLIKTGGLADVAGSLPRALVNMGEDVRLVIPAYHDVRKNLEKSRQLVQTHIQNEAVSILQGRLPGTRVTVWLVDCPIYFDRPGNPYHDADGVPWSDNAFRFALFCRVIAEIANDAMGLDWQPDVIHLNDWQTGLVPVLLHPKKNRPATVFTIHNLAYQGNFDHATFTQLGLDPALWYPEALEFHQQVSFIKGGLVFADQVNTVSPSYATEIQTPAFGHGMEGLLHHVQGKLSGIVNGIDEKEWDPAADALIAHHYNWRRLQDKQANKQVLQQTFGLAEKNDTLLLALISRLVEQKGIDLLLAGFEKLFDLPVQLVILGSGEKQYESAMRDAEKIYPGQFAVRIGYDEALAHQIEAGADVFLMPSRFEPCGLNQMYSQRYGTLPVVSPVGGLRDTVVDATPASIENETATGFVMKDVSTASLLAAVENAARYFQEPEIWQALQKQAMKQDFSWQRSAQAYVQLYKKALTTRELAIKN